MFCKLIFGFHFVQTITFDGFKNNLKIVLFKSIRNSKRRNKGNLTSISN